MPDYNTPPVFNPLEVYAIANPDRRTNSVGHNIWYTIVSPWERGFYATPTPKLFQSPESAIRFCQENSIDRFEVVRGWVNGSQGFFPGVFTE